MLIQQYEVTVSVSLPVRVSDGFVSYSAELQQSPVRIRQYNAQLHVPLQQCEVPVSVGSTVRVSDGFVSHSGEVQQSLVRLRQYYAEVLCANTTV